MVHERAVFENVARARAGALGAKSVAERSLSENVLSSALKGFFAVVENYPLLKADAQMRALHEELVSTENRIAFARQFYNEEAMHLNIAIESFPGNLVAGALGFVQESFFAFDDVAQAAVPNVGFGG
jgi:LemA protein